MSTRTPQTERIIERKFQAIGDNLDNTWQPVVTLRGFTHEEAIARLHTYSKKYGAGKVRMLQGCR